MPNRSHSGFVLAIRSAGAGLFVLLALLGSYAYPFASATLILPLLVYAGLLLWRPQLWLLLFPPILALLNLAPWSGSFFLEEFDLFVLVTAACLLARGQYGSVWRMVSPIRLLLLVLFGLAWLVALVNGLWPLPALEADSFGSYYSHYNALRIAKPFAWALLLLPALAQGFRADPGRAKGYITGGLALAILGVGLVALWERGSLTAILYAQNRYSIIQSLLDFTTAYRITGLFSEMHTGGEAIDGFLALSLPFALLAAVQAKSLRMQLLGGMAAALGLYAAAVTFSRATYLAVAVVLLVMALVAWRTRSGKAPLPWPAMLGGIACLGLLAFLYQKGGSLLLFSALLALCGALLAGYWKTRLSRMAWLALGGACFVLAAYGASRGMLTSKWSEVVKPDALAWSLAVAAAVSLSGMQLGSRMRGVASARGLALGMVVVLAVAGTLIPALFGYRMESRFAEVSRDFSTRSGHWREAVSVMDNKPLTPLIGMGFGRFPETFFWTKGVDEVGTYRFEHEDGSTYLAMRSGKDLRYGQRVELPAYQTYTLTFDARPHAQDLKLRLRICRRHIIEPLDWNGQCVVFLPDMHNKQDQWQHLSWTFNMGSLGDGAQWGRASLMLELSNLREYVYATRPATRVDIDNLRLTDGAGNEYLRNGDFERAWQGWFPYFDFSHLPWHAKNLWVGIYFDQGMLGVAAFAALVLAGLWRSLRLLRAGDAFAGTLLAALSGFLTVGLFGTLIDVPRIMLLFYLILFSAFVMPRQR